MLLEENDYIIQEHLTLKNTNFQIERAQQVSGLNDDDGPTLRHIIAKCHNTEKMNSEELFLKSHMKTME